MLRPNMAAVDSLRPHPRGPEPGPAGKNQFAWPTTREPDILRVRTSCVASQNFTL